MCSILTSSILLLIFSSALAGPPTVGFLEQAEDVEREAWWVLTASRSETGGSPFRVIRAAFLQQSKKTHTKVNLKYCRKLKVTETIRDSLWRIDSECQKKTVEVGSLQKQQGSRWKLQWIPSAFQDHFGLGASILYTKGECDLKTNDQGKLTELSCPGYARNRNADEIVELAIFHFQADKEDLLKLKGVVKKDLEKISSIETQVPLKGEIVVKEKQVQVEKPVEESTDLSNIKQTQKSEGSDGKK